VLDPRNYPPFSVHTRVSSSSDSEDEGVTPNFGKLRTRSKSPIEKYGSWAYHKVTSALSKLSNKKGKSSGISSESDSEKELSTLFEEIMEENGKSETNGDDMSHNQGQNVNPDITTTQSTEFFVSSDGISKEKLDLLTKENVENIMPKKDIGLPPAQKADPKTRFFFSVDPIASSTGVNRDSGTQFPGLQFPDQTFSDVLRQKEEQIEVLLRNKEKVEKESVT